VTDKTTGKPKGTAFIEFKAPEPAAAAAAAAARARDGKGPAVTVKGVTLSVDLALTQDDARRLGAERGSGPGGGAQGLAAAGAAGAAGGKGSAAGPGGKGADRRNLYLAKEGAFEEGSAVWAAMSENDRWAVYVCDDVGQGAWYRIAEAPGCGSSPVRFHCSLHPLCVAIITALNWL
jgi:nucleolar protein 4